jgi:hypothetical protein
VRARGEARLAHGPDPLPLADPLPAVDQDPGEVPVERLVAVGVTDLHRTAETSPPAGPGHDPVGRRHHRCPRRGGVVDAEVGPPYLEDRMEPGATEARRDPGEPQG